jgi:WD40 repeat protein
MSSNGKHLVIGGVDGTSSLWELEAPDAEPAILKGHKDRVRNVAFSLDGSFVLTSGVDGTVRRWRVGEPTAEPVVINPPGDISVVAFSPDGSRVLTVSIERTRNKTILLLWGLNDPTPRPVELFGRGSFTRNAAFSLDGSIIGSWATDFDDIGESQGSVRIWSVKPPSPNPRVLPVPGRIGSEDSRITFDPIVFSPDGSRLVALSLLWNLASPREPPIRLRASAPMSAAAFAPDGSRLVTGTSDGVVELWRAKQPTAAPVRLVGHKSAIRELAFQGGSQLVTLGADGTARIWSVDPPGGGHDGSASEPQISGNPERLLAQWQKKLALEITNDGEIVPVR